MPSGNKRSHVRRATRGGDGGKPPLPFYENRPDFGKKGSSCVHPWVESSIQNVVLRVSRRKSSKTIPCGAFFCVFDEKFIEMPKFHKTFPVLKNFW